MASNQKTQPLGLSLNMEEPKTPNLEINNEGGHTTSASPNSSQNESSHIVLPPLQSMSSPNNSANGVARTDEEENFESKKEWQEAQSRIRELEDSLLRAQAETRLVKKSCVVLLREKEDALEKLKEANTEKIQLANEVARQKMLLDELNEQRENLANNAQFLSKMSRLKDENETLQTHLKQAQDRLENERMQFGIRESQLNASLGAATSRALSLQTQFNQIQGLNSSISSISQDSSDSLLVSSGDQSNAHPSFVSNRLAELEQTNLKLSQGLAESEEKRHAAKREVMHLLTRIERERRQWAATELSLRLEISLVLEKLNAVEDLWGTERTRVQSSTSSTSLGSLHSGVGQDTVESSTTSPTSPNSNPLGAQDEVEMATQRAIIIQEVNFDGLDFEMEKGTLTETSSKRSVAKRSKRDLALEACKYPSHALMLSLGMTARSDLRLQSSYPTGGSSKVAPLLPTNPLYRDFGFSFEQLGAMHKLGLDPSGPDEVNADIDQFPDLFPVVPLDKVHNQEILDSTNHLITNPRISESNSISVSPNPFGSPSQPPSCGIQALEGAAQHLASTNTPTFVANLASKADSNSPPQYAQVKCVRALTMEAAVDYYLITMHSRLSKLEALIVWMDQLFASNDLKLSSKGYKETGSTQSSLQEECDKSIGVLRKVCNRMKAHAAISLFSCQESLSLVSKWRGHRKRLQNYWNVAVHHMRMKQSIYDESQQLGEAVSSRDEQIYTSVIRSALSCGNLIKLLCSKVFGSCTRCCCCTGRSSTSSAPGHETYTERFSNLLRSMMRSMVYSELDDEGDAEALESLDVYGEPNIAVQPVESQSALPSSSASSTAPPTSVLETAEEDHRLYEL